jgi:hypothetical protein
MNPSNYINSMLDRSRRENDAQKFETLDRNELSRMDDKTLAAWQGEFSSDQPQWRLAEHEWQQRLTDRQIAASHATARRAALWGACSGIAGALAGVLLAWVLSGQHPPSLYTDLQHRQNPPVSTPSDKATNSH